MTGVMPTAARSIANDASRQRLDAIVRRHRQSLQAYAVMLCGSVADAQDLVQVTFERLCAAPLQSLPPARERAWLCTVLRRLFVDEYRRRARSGRHVDADLAALPLPADADPVTAWTTAPEPALDWRELDDDDLSAALAQLDEPFAHAFCLHAAGRSYAEIAAALAIPVKTVGTRLLRARRKLRVALTSRMQRRALVARVSRR